MGNAQTKEAIVMSKNWFDVAGKVAVVTGASQGIGAALVGGLHEAAARVIGIDVVQESEGGDKADLFELCDVRDRAGIEGVAQRVIDRFGRVDILVNAAAIARASMALETSQEDWDDVMGVNAGGTFLCCQAFGRHMIAQRYGKIVNFSSISAYIGYPEYTSYNVSKAAVIGITQSLAVEWARHNVWVNAVAPASVRTPMTQYVWGDPELSRSAQSRSLMGRWAEPEELVGVVLFLASPASDWITGVTLLVDGGNLVDGRWGKHLHSERDANQA
jgi:NAD(P)-dependent dehydrogenase (short-subunit alcohol dehydrogenase family)